MTTGAIEPVAVGRRTTTQRFRHRLRVGPWQVDACFVTPADAADASLSRQAACLAEELVAGHLDVDRDTVRLAALMPSGRPVAVVDGMPSGMSVSISHLDGLVGAGTCDDARVGLDIVDPAEAGRGLDVWFTPDELALLPDDHGLLRPLLWAAKEAAYKAAHLDTEFRPRTVTILDLSPSGFTWTAGDRFAHVRGSGRFIGIHGHVVAVAVAAPPRSPFPARSGLPEVFQP